MKVKVIKMANTNKRYEPEFKKRWSGWYQKKDEPSQASIKSITQEKELSGAGSDSLKKNAKRSSFPKKSSRILRKGNRLEQYQFIDQYHNEFGVRWLLDRFHIYPNSYYNYKKNKKAGYLADKEKKKQQILSIYYEYDRRPGYRMMVIFLRRRGIRLSRATVLKYMRELKLRSV